MYDAIARNELTEFMYRWMSTSTNEVEPAYNIVWISEDGEKPKRIGNITDVFIREKGMFKAVVEASFFIYCYFLCYNSTVTFCVTTLLLLFVLQLYCYYLSFQVKSANTEQGRQQMENAVLGLWQEFQTEMIGVLCVNGFVSECPLQNSCIINCIFLCRRQ